MQIMKIFRCDTSPYQDPNFSIKEKQELESIGCTYLESNKGAQALITNTNTQNPDTKGIELIIHPNSGYDNFSQDFISKADFPIVIGSEIRANAVTEYILYCLLERFSQIPFQKSWDRSWKNRSLLRGQQVLLLGQGKIGTLVIKSISPLVDKVWTVDPFLDDTLNTPFEVPLHQCGIVILACGLNETSGQILDSQVFKSLSGNTTIINAARGKLINQEDLLTFLQANPKSHAYLDVFEKEPTPLEELNLANLSLTSHIAGVFDNLDDSIIKFEKRVIADFKNDRINFEKKYHDSILKNRIHDNILI
jgi:phosphoglycerate dehydrogenase-like enzyme